MVCFPPGDRIRSVQLYGVDPATVAGGVRVVVEELGAQHVDLNFGCPVPKVTRKGGGSALPAHPRLFGAIVGAAVRAAGTVPVTVKMRLGIDDGRITAFTAGRVAEAEGAAAVTLHARTAEQHYSGTARWDAIARLKAEVVTIPVLGNGDIWHADDAVRMVRDTGCDGVVVGRGCLGRPWFFAELDAAFAGRPLPAAPSLAEVCAAAAEHARLLVDAFGEGTGVREMRKHIGWYLHDVAAGGERRRRLMAAGTLAEVVQLLAEVGERADTPPAPGRRGPSTGPRRVVLPDGWLDRDLGPEAVLEDVAAVGG
jgi:nifR3 family TIM-barrel protein